MSFSQKKSSEWFERAQQYFPGGVNSPVRAFKAVGGTPPVFTKGEGPYLFDLDGNRYLDYVGSWGPLILGHCHSAVMEAVMQTVQRGSSFGAPAPSELELAELVKEMMPAIEMMRFVSSGTEATMSALRLARGFTGRDKIVKFAGCYHGHSDMLLAKAGSGVATLGIPGSPGIPASLTQDTIVLPYNDLNAVEEAFTANRDQIAAVIVEPIAGNMGMILPRADYLKGICDLCRAHGALVIFDEVMTGFRVALGGAQALYEIEPDLTCLGKVLGGGFPCAAFGGRAEVMKELAPVGPVYQAGTLSGNPVAMAAGAATLRLLREKGRFDELTQRTSALAQGMNERADRHGIALQVSSRGGMLGFFFNNQPVTNYDQAARSDSDRFKRFFHEMLERGHYFAPSQYEAAFVSLAHRQDDIDSTLVAVDEVFSALSSST